MFDPVPFDAADEAYYARQAAGLDLIDEWEVDGWAPAVEPSPSDGEVCAEVADPSTALVPALLSRLDVVDLDALAGAAAADAAAAWDRVANRVAARRVRASPAPRCSTSARSRSIRSGGPRRSSEPCCGWGRRRSAPRSTWRCR